MRKHHTHLKSYISLTQWAILVHLVSWAAALGQEGQEMFAEQLWGNNQRKKWRAGVNPVGHPYCVTPSLGSKGHGRRRGKDSMKGQVVHSFKDHHALQTWANEQWVSTLALSEPACERFQMWAEQFWLLGGRRTHSQEVEPACLMACIGLSLLSHQGKISFLQGALLLPPSLCIPLLRSEPFSVQMTSPDAWGSVSDGSFRWQEALMEQ